MTLATIDKFDLQERFAQLVALWKDKSRHMSNSAQMAMLKPYQQIIGLGEPAVPLILRELQREPDHWFWALEAITQVNPVKPVPTEVMGRVQQMADACIVWGKKQGYLSE